MVVYECTTQSLQQTLNASEINVPPTRNGMSSALQHALASQMIQATHESTVEIQGSKRHYDAQANFASQEGIHLAQIETTLEQESPMSTIKKEESELSRVPSTPDAMHTEHEQYIPQRS
jgi:hypothetical protein